jgi:hypothetical protein
LRFSTYKDIQHISQSNTNSEVKSIEKRPNLSYNYNSWSEKLLLLQLLQKM